MEKIEKIELKHLCGYLPYKLEVFSEVSSTKTTLLRNLSLDSPQWILDEIKPLLLPLSALTEPLEDGTVPIVESAKIAFPKATKFIHMNNDICFVNARENYKFDFIEQDYTFSCTHFPDVRSCYIPNQLQLFEYLYSKHFDIFDLIGSGLAIDKRTVKL